MSFLNVLTTEMKTQTIVKYEDKKRWSNEKIYL